MQRPDRPRKRAPRRARATRSRPALRLGEIAQPKPFEFAGIGDAVKIEMMRVERAGAVRLDQAVGRTLDALADAERCQQRPREVVLPAPRSPSRWITPPSPHRAASLFAMRAQRGFVDALGSTTCAHSSARARVAQLV